MTLFVIIFLFFMRGVPMAETAMDVDVWAEGVSEQYKIFSTDNDNLQSNFSFVINKDITMVETGELDSAYKPAYTLYYPRTRDEFEINVYIVNFDVTVFAAAVAEVYAIVKDYENLMLKFKRNKQGEIVPSIRTSSLNRVVIRGDTENYGEEAIYSVYSFEKMVVIIDAHVQKEHYEKYQEDIEQIREKFRFLKPFIPENHVQEFKNATFSYLFPKGWKPSKFAEVPKDTGLADGIIPWAMRLYWQGLHVPLFTFFTYDVPFHEWERVHSKLPFVDIMKQDETIIVNDNVVKRKLLSNNDEVLAWEFLYSVTIKENNIKTISIVRFVRLKETNKIVVYIYDNIDIELNNRKQDEEFFRLSCIGKSAADIIYLTLTNTYSPYFADKFYLD